MSSITLPGGSIRYGTVEAVYAGAPRLQIKLTSFWGVIGESELRGERGMRTIEVLMTLHNGYPSHASLLGELAGIDICIGNHGNLVIDSSAPRTFHHVTFDGFTPGRSPEDGPLPDVAGGFGGGTNSWFVRGVFRFHQNLVD